MAGSPDLMTADYAELHCLSHFSFGRGASSARELFRRAAQLDYRALAITDECTFSGIVRALEAAREFNIALIVGTEITLDGNLKLVLLAENATGYSNLCRLITHGRRCFTKGNYAINREELRAGLPGVLVLWIPAFTNHADDLDEPLLQDGHWLQTVFGSKAWLAVELHRETDDATRLRRLLALAEATHLRPVATGDAHMHVRKRRPVQDTLTAIRHRTTLASAGTYLFPNGEHHLRTRSALSEIYPRALLDETIAIANRCHFDLGELNYTYPSELVPVGHTASSWLQKLTMKGSAWRWPMGIPASVQTQIKHELALISELQYEAFFLTVHDVVKFARSRDILCQGRGSAANSAVCFALGVTEVDPAHHNMLFERFISRERKEPPDIDVDFEHERREEVIQYIYAKYGRERAALAATVICYRPKSAVRDVAKALGLPNEQVAKLVRVFAGWDGNADLSLPLGEHGFDPESPILHRIIEITAEILDAPRHLSQHVGGFVISEKPLHHLVPVENASMPDRTIIQWDKDDLETLGLLKVDCLALGMLTCISKCLALLRGVGKKALTPASIPSEDPATYAMIQRADTVGVFQIESRAQMAMLPRLKPASFYDLVIEVAIVRPGPIQGDMVHPYLRRRQGIESIAYPSEELRAVFERTLGVPLFQEQVMQLAIVAAGFTPGEADQLRRAMAAWKRRGGLDYFRDQLLSGMAARGYSAEFATQIFEQIKGFGSYGFPESHAASFALITYVSCWLKCHEPAAFTCALLNSQPMGFYSVSQLLQDAQRHGIKIRPIDVRFSAWDSTLETITSKPEAQSAIRLGFREIKGFQQAVAARIVTARTERFFADVHDLCYRAVLDARDRSLLADAAALRGLAGHRHRARWEISGVGQSGPLLHGPITAETAVSLPVPTTGETVVADYTSTGFSLGPHPLSLLRARLRAQRCRSSHEISALSQGTLVKFTGLVTLRQRPSTASGTTFLTLEDENGMINVIVWRSLAERQRRVLLEATLLQVDGHLETADGVQHLIAGKLTDRSPLLKEIHVSSRDFR